MAELNEARNNPHIQAVETISKQIEAVEALVTEKPKYDKIGEAVKVIINDIRGRYNNREMAIVITKLQEAGHWTADKEPTIIKRYLAEARHWCGEYVDVLKLLNG